MIKLKHTPGPLTIKGPSKFVSGHNDGGDYAVKDKDNKIIAEAINMVGNNNYRDAEANAKLIAVAPEMLDFLIELYLHEFTPDPLKQFTANITKNIIEKATGQKIEDILK